MVEFICGLVGVMVVVAMLLQVNRIGREHVLSVIRARKAMAVELTGSSSRGEADYLSDWDDGGDMYAYSEDDEAQQGLSGKFTAALFNAVHGDDLNVFLPTNRFADVYDSYSSGVVESFDLTRVQDETEPIEILPVVRKLIYGQDEMVLTHEIYMPWINNVMD